MEVLTTSSCPAVAHVYTDSEAAWTATQAHLSAVFERWTGGNRRCAVGGRRRIAGDIAPPHRLEDFIRFRSSGRSGADQYRLSADERVHITHSVAS